VIFSQCCCLGNPVERLFASGQFGVSLRYLSSERTDRPLKPKTPLLYALREKDLEGVVLIKLQESKNSTLKELY